MAEAMDTGISAKGRSSIAERIRALGRYPPGSYQQYIKLATVKQSDGVPTLDPLTQRLDIHEKNAWMPRSLLKK